MKIVYLVLSPMDQKEVVRRAGLLKRWASPGVEVDIRCVSQGPGSIESQFEECLSIPAAAKEIFRLEKEGYHAAILGCIGDPGLYAMREITTGMAVIGPGETSLHIAAMLGHRFTVLSPVENAIASFYELAHRAAVTAKLASVRAINVAVLDLASNKAATLERIIHEGREAIQEDRADTLILGCMSMGFLDIAEEVQESLKIPVINPSKTALRMAETWVGSGLSHSKKAFQLPPKLATGKVASLDELFV
jgi:allantoin racemase